MVFRIAPPDHDAVTAHPWPVTVTMVDEGASISDAQNRTPGFPGQSHVPIDVLGFVTIEEEDTVVMLLDLPVFLLTGPQAVGVQPLPPKLVDEVSHETFEEGVVLWKERLRRMVGPVHREMDIHPHEEHLVVPVAAHVGQHGLDPVKDLGMMTEVTWMQREIMIYRIVDNVVVTHLNIRC
jgi:hypothetical protein